MKLNVFGRYVEVVRNEEKWIVYYLGSEGKKRVAEDVVIPSTVHEDDLVEYIADLCHEWATPNKSEVTVIKRGLK